MNFAFRELNSLFPRACGECVSEIRRWDFPDLSIAGIPQKTEIIMITSVKGRR